MSVALFSLSLLLSAGLLFSMQPMIGKMVAPALGGAPAVWTTIMTFFQACLLCGYLWAHWLSRRSSLRAQIAIQIAMLLVAAVSLPFAVAIYDASESVAAALAVALVAGPGLAAFAVSTSAPLLQAWFSQTAHKWATDPYFLYAASNVGSFVALLGYPLIFERLVPLDQQASLWAGGFAVLLVLTAGCGLHAVNHRKEHSPNTSAADLPPLAGGWRRRLLWLGLSFIPSSAMLGTTEQLVARLAAVPLVWVLPLALYLATFVIAFLRRRPFGPEPLARILPYALLVFAPLLAAEIASLPWVLVALTLIVFVVVALLGHLRLADARPGPERLTEFYLFVSIGGVLGGLFNAGVAPLLFDRLSELPLILVAACLMLPTGRPGRTDRADLLWPLGLAITTFALLGGVHLLELNPNSLLVRVSLIGVPSVVCFGFKERPIRFALGFAVLCALYASYMASARGNVLHVQRNFFGVKEILKFEKTQAITLVHGGVAHGLQLLDEARRDEPFTYYDRMGPVGDAFRAYRDSAVPRRIGVIGLGVGVMAAYVEEDDTMVFFEIDPAVVQIARNENYFSYLSRCGERCSVIVSDGRTGLSAQPAGSFGLIVVDAFSGGRIPSHLLTVQALQAYMQRLAPGGSMALHVSNRHFDLEGLMAAATRATGWAAAIRYDLRKTDIISPSHWVLIRRQGDALRPADLGPDWRALRRDLRPPWTDRHTDLIDFIRR